MFKRTSIILLLAAAGTAFAAQAVLAQKASQLTAFRIINIETLPGASVWLDGVNYGKADENGKFTIKTVSTGGHKLVVRAVGYQNAAQVISPSQKGDVRLKPVLTNDPAELAFQEAERLTLVDRDQAVEAFQKAISLRPNFPEAYVAMARVQTELGDLEEAEKAISSARKLRPVYPEAAAVLGRIYRETGEEAKASAAFKKAIAEGKGFQPEAYTGLGLLYKEKAEAAGGSGDFAGEKTNYDEAAKDLKIALKQLSGAPDANVIYQLLGLIYERQKRYADAIALYEEFLRIFPDSSDATAVRSFIVQIRKDMAQPQ